MAKQLTIASGLKLPIEIAGQTIGLLGIRGSGKTNTAGVIAEELLDHQQPIVVIDPTDAWWGLRTGYEVFIFGGPHGDIELNETDGKIIAEFLVTERVPVILSLRHLRKGAQRRFVTDFCEELYHLKGKDRYRSPLTVFIDEAPLFVPQKVMGEVARTVGAVEDLIARGRNSGFGVVLISQRPATINKDVLTQADTIITHRLTSPQDRKALGEWIEENATVEKHKEILTSLASMPNGKAWIWSPRLDIMQQVQIRLRHTFDSSASPKVGQKTVAPKNLKDIDLGKLKDKLAAAVEAKKANDPTEIKKQLTAVTKELEAERKKKLPAAAPSPTSVKPIIDEEAISKAVHIAVEKERKETKIFLTKVFTSLNFLSKSLKNESDSVGDALVSITNYLDVQAAKLIEVPKVTIKIAKRQAAPALPASTTTAAVQATRQPTIKSDGDLRIPEGVQKMLDTLAVIDDGLDAKSLGGRVGISNKRSTFRAHIAFANKHGLITGSRSGYTITDAGRSYASETAAPLSGEELIEYWINKLSLGAGKALRVLVDAGQALDRLTLAERIEVDPSKSTFRAILAELRVYDLIGGSDEIHAADHLFT